jgi:hypothetical protein
MVAEDDSGHTWQELDASPIDPTVGANSACNPLLPRLIESILTLTHMTFSWTTVAASPSQIAWMISLNHHNHLTY